MLDNLFVLIYSSLHHKNGSCLTLYFLCCYTKPHMKTKGSVYIYRPGGTGPVGPAMAGPTFELGRNFFLLN